MNCHVNSRIAATCLCVMLWTLGQSAPPGATGPETLGFEWVEEACPDSFNCRITYVPIQQRGTFTLAIDSQPNGDRYELALSRGGLELTAVVNGESVSLARTRGYRPKSYSQPLELLVKRRPGELTVVQGPSLVLSVTADQFAEGDLGFAGQLGNDSSPHLQFQPTGEVYLTDDFMRSSTDESLWQQVSGRWVMNSVSKVGGRPSMSSNPFCVLNKSTQRSVLTTGQWFWDNYEISASVRPEGQGWMGLCGYFRDEDNYLLFRCSPRSPSESGVRQLVVRLNGRDRVLAEEPGGYDPEQWYRMAFKVTDRYLAGYLDGALVVHASNEYFGGGRAAAFCEGLDRYYLDDVVAQDCNDVLESFEGAGTLQWTPVTGGWTTQSGAYLGQPYREKGYALTTAGRRTWQNYRARTRVSATEEAPVGIAANVQDPENLIRLTAEPTEQPNQVALSLAVVEAGKAQVRARRVVPGTVAGEHSLELITDRGYLAGAWDGVRYVETLEPGRRTGGIGLLHAQGKPVSFDDLTVEFVEAAKALEPPPVAESMVTDNLMVDWSSPAGSWRPPDQAAEGVRWHRGTFFADASLSYPLERARAEKLQLLLGGQAGKAAEGFTVALDGQGKCQLLLDGKPVREEALPTEGETLTVGWRGAALTVTVDDKPPLLYAVAPSVPAGRLVGLRATGAVDFAALKVASRKLRDYLFTQAPVDWYVQRGLWGTTTRWNCKKDWSFFGAHDEVGKDYFLPTIWTKDAFRGDLVFEMYAGLPMDTHPNPGYLDPSDLNCTLFGDGRDLSSGYSFMYAGWYNTRSALWRRSRIVGDSERHRFVNPISSNPAYHRHWFYVRAEKIGSKVRYLVDDSLIAEYDDPEPLEVGRVALWSFHNGLMVARARIWFDEAVPGDPFPLPPQQDEIRTVRSRNRTLYCNFERDFGTFSVEDLPDHAVLSREAETSAKGRFCLKATNPTTGGPFCFWVSRESFDLKEIPKVSFDYRFPPEAKLNLYFKIGDQYHVVILTGEEQDESAAKILGGIPDFKADGQWHHAEFSLRAALRIAYGREVQGEVKRLAIASPQNHKSYLRAGFGGNPLGTAVYFDNFSLGE